MVHLVLGKHALKSAQLRYSNPEVTQKRSPSACSQRSQGYFECLVMVSMLWIPQQEEAPIPVLSLIQVVTGL